MIDPAEIFGGESINRIGRPLGSGIVIGAGCVMGLVELQHAREMSSDLGITVFAILPFLANLVVIGSGIVLWRSESEGRDLLRIAGWMLLGMSMIGLLAFWTITHQFVRGRAFAHAPFVTVNNLSVGALVGVLIGWYDVRRHRHRRQAETERARLDFIHGSLRHNVLNGLNVILGEATVLADQTNGEATEHVEAIQDRSRELTRFTEATKTLIENFVGYSLDDPSHIRLREILEKSVQRTQTEFPEATISVGTLPDVEFEGDDLAPELFSNLLENAVVHNDTEPSVEVSANRVGETVVVRVADNGPGIPDDRKDAVRDWNERGVDSSGTGLGLSIAETVANRYGGRLWIEDNEPRGTVVCVELPIADALETEPRSTERDIGPSASAT